MPNARGAASIDAFSAGIDVRRVTAQMTGPFRWTAGSIRSTRPLGVV